MKLVRRWNLRTGTASGHRDQTAAALREFPKPLTDDVVRAADLVVTMGCGDACPVYPGKRYLDWELSDPAGKSLAEVRVIRDEIDRHVQDLLTQLQAER